MRLAGAEGLVVPTSVPFDEESTWAAIAAVHDPAYVEAVRTGDPRSLAESQGFRWSAAFAESVARIWSGHKQACRLAREEGLVLHPVSGAHHADRDRGSAYCTFNYLVGGARVMATDMERPVAIIDLDAHPGDGTFRFTRDDPALALFDVAGSRWCNAPRTDRVEYHVAHDADEYRAALTRLPAFLDRVRPGLVQYQAGLDPCEDDPVGVFVAPRLAVLRGERHAFWLERIDGLKRRFVRQHERMDRRAEPLRVRVGAVFPFPQHTRGRTFPHRLKRAGAPAGQLEIVAEVNVVRNAILRHPAPALSVSPPTGPSARTVGRSMRNTRARRSALPRESTASRRRSRAYARAASA